MPVARARSRGRGRRPLSCALRGRFASAPPRVSSPEGFVANAAGAEPVERLVRLLELEHLDVRADWDLRRELQELAAVGPRQVGNRAHRPLAPQELVWKRRNVAHVNPSADDAAAL